MAAAERFPPHLLAQPPADRLAYFAAKVVAHPRLKHTHLAVLNTVREPAGASLILVIGPTGVGKTTLRLRLEQQLIERALPELERDPGRLPVVALEAAAPESGQFNWKDYYTRALLALEEPLIEHKIDHALRGNGHHGTGRVRIERSTAAADLRRALEECLCQRRVAVVIVDEAQHLKRLTSGRRLLDQMDTLKSLAALSGTVHVLVGTYELLGLADLSAQLSRRSVVIHFGRYHAEVAEDLLAFKSVLLTFQRHLPLAAEPDLLGHWEEFYERSAGCVGVLKNWLQRGLAAALEAGASTLDRQHLERHAASTRTLLSLARESTEGEAALVQTDRERDELRLLLGLEIEPKALPAATSNGLGASRSTGMAPRCPPVELPSDARRAIQSAMGGWSMRADELTVYEGWDLARPPIPPRSRLFSLEPVGIGTPGVESLTGYVARLATTHGVLVRRLVEDEILPLLGRSYLLGPGHTGGSSSFRPPCSCTSRGSIPAPVGSPP